MRPQENVLQHNLHDTGIISYHYNTIYRLYHPAVILTAVTVPNGSERNFIQKPPTKDLHRNRTFGVLVLLLY